MTHFPGNDMSTASENAKIWRRAFAETGAQAHRLLRLMYEPLSFLHPARLAQWFPREDDLQILLRTRRGWLTINGWLLEKLGLAMDCPTPPLLPRQCLIFEKVAELRRLALFLGTAIFSREICRIVRRREREEMLAILGPTLHNFALRKALFFQPPPLPMAKENFGGSSIGEKAIAAGKLCLMTCIFDIPPALRERFLLKFSPADGWPFPKKTDKKIVEQLWIFVDRLRSRYGSGEN
jgi:hypothetical protein